MSAEEMPVMDKEALDEFLHAAHRAINDGSVIDMAKAMIQTAGDEEFLQEIVADLEKEALDHFSKIRKALPLRNVQQCRFSSHSIKGAAANLFAKQLQHSAAAIEHLCRLALAGKLNEPNWVEGVTALLKMLSASIQRFRAAAHSIFA